LAWIVRSMHLSAVWLEENPPITWPKPSATRVQAHGGRQIRSTISSSPPVAWCWQ
jgi:hypothetical protein